MTSRALFGVYADAKKIRGAVDMLNARGVRDSDIDLFYPRKSRPTRSKDLPYQLPTQIKSGAILGIFLGIIIGTILGVSIGVGVIPFPGLSPFTSSGAFMSSLAGGVVGGLIGAGIGALIGIGTPLPAADRYEEYLKEGGIVLSVKLRDSYEKNEIQNVLAKTGAQDIHDLPNTPNGVAG